MDDCVFCKIVKGDIPSFKIYEDDMFLAILDIAQFTEGHTILIPKKHHRFVWDIPEIGEYYEVAQKISDHFRENLGFKYVDSLTLGRMVPHAHLHIIPHNGEENDFSNAIEGIGNLQTDASRRLSSEEGKKVQKKFSLL
jgi:histidine triad (HIT) family protein